MSYNKDWPRWIKASVYKHLRTGIVAAGYTVDQVYLEGASRKTNQLENWFELRMDGPWSQEYVKDYYHLTIEVNVLCTCAADRDIYSNDRMTGLVGSLFTNTIPAYKYGDGVDDDGSLLGCLNLTREPNRQEIIVSQFGLIEPKVKLIQASVEARYWIELE